MIIFPSRNASIASSMGAKTDLRRPPEVLYSIWILYACPSCAAGACQASVRTMYFPSISDSTLTGSPERDAWQTRVLPCERNDLHRTGTAIVDGRHGQTDAVEGDRALGIDEGQERRGSIDRQAVAVAFLLICSIVSVASTWP